MSDRVRTVTVWAAALAALTCVSVGLAHHSISMFDISKPIWVKGTVARYQPISPHALIALDQTGKDGKVQRWIVEGPSPFRLKRMGVAEDFLKAGDAMEICAPVQSWVNFLNTEPLAREAWCGFRTKGATDEVDKLMANRCN